MGTMTLLELCDIIKANLIMKRSIKRGEVVYSVYLEDVLLYKTEVELIYNTDSYIRPIILDKDINKALYELCDLISCKWVDKEETVFYTGIVEKDKLSVLGVW